MARRTRDPRRRKAVLCSTELRDKKHIDHGIWYAQEESNLQPRSGPELTTGISRPLCQLSYGREIGQGGWIRTNGLLHPRQALSPG